MRRKVLNVAEKPSIAKLIAGFLSNNSSSKLRSESKFNPVFSFNRDFQGNDAEVLVTSVTGHIQEIRFPDKYKIWTAVSPCALLNEAPIEKHFSEDKMAIVRNLLKYSLGITDLVLWLDFDREGEAICFEVIDACKGSIPQSAKIHRAHFSAATRTNIIYAYENLKVPNELARDAVDVRQELDLRGGAAFTRLQCLTIQDAFTDKFGVISYGSCQFPTLNFIVERDSAIDEFNPEKYWYFDLRIIGKNGKSEDVEVSFNWDKGKLFDYNVAALLYKEMIRKSGDQAKVLEITKKEVKKFKPYPLNTVTLQKIATKSLKMAGHEVMAIAEKLYTKGFISYPRTETNLYDKTINLKSILQNLTGSSDTGRYAQELADQDSGKYLAPRNGTSNDKAHPPIHPVKTPSGLDSKEMRVYDLILRHFLAQNSKDAVGDETEILVTLGEELFSKKGILVRERNFLEVYPFMKWADNELPIFEEGAVLVPSACLLSEGTTTPPIPMTESELISLMEKNQIGTDATIHEHIKKIQDRRFILKQGQTLRSTPLGKGLINTYKQMEIRELFLPQMRSALEMDISGIAEGTKSKNDILKKYKRILTECFTAAELKKSIYVDELGKYYNRK